MAQGGLDLALVVGGEALATRRHLPDPAWSFAPAEAAPFPLTIDRAEGPTASTRPTSPLPSSTPPGGPTWAGRRPTIASIWAAFWRR